MAESKILEEDRDEWIYQSMQRYSNLYMFEMEFPVDAIELIDDTSICLTGLQAYSKKCEVLQLSIPPKLLPKDIEEGLCKDRDFKIISGGYASTKVVQVKPISSNPSFVTGVQLGHNGITLFKLGDENYAVLKEHSKLKVPNSPEILSAEYLPGVIDTSNNRIVMGSSDGRSLYEWTLDESNSSIPTCVIHNLSSASVDPWGGIIKLKFWDENSVIFITGNGAISLKDLRTNTPGIISYAEKSPSNPETTATTTEMINAAPEKALEDNASNASPIPIFNFDCIPHLNKVGIVDSYGGYETLDPRRIGGLNISKSAPGDRIILPGFDKNPGIIRSRFNIEYSPVSSSRSGGSEETTNSYQFIVTGLRESCVQVFEELPQKTSEPGSQIRSKFVHDGHTKTVSHALWHPRADRLVFSASIDSILHAWQFNPDFVT